MITPSQFNVFVTSVNTMVAALYADDTVPEVYQMYAQTVPSESSQEEYGWIGRLPKPREWVGSRIVVSPAAQTYILVNRPYELTVEVDRFHLDDDKFGIYYTMIPQMAIQTKRLPSFWTRDLLENSGIYTGAAQNGYDGLTYFSTAHPVDVYSSAAGTYVNDFTGASGVSVTGGIPGGSGSAISVGGPFSPTSLATIAEYMLAIPGEDGEALGVMPTMAMFPTSLWMESELVIRSQSMAPPVWGQVGTGSSNTANGPQVGAADNPIRRFGITPVVNRYLKNGTRFYVFDDTKVVKPMVWQVREPAVFTPRVAESDPNVFERHAYSWGTWGRVNAGWGYSFLMARGGPS
jgi:phage major head subunit gpT-like protein